MAVQGIGDILYGYGAGIYLNITNRCPCSCDFCIRHMTDALGGADSLWLKREPTVSEVIEEMKKWDLSGPGELVFCGYGEPLVRLDDVLLLCQWIKTNTGRRTRVNTNGLSDLIHKKETAPMLAGYFDAVSVSLNAPTAQAYNALCHPEFGEASFDAILHFTREVKKVVPDVTMSVVSVISGPEIEACRRIAQDDLGVQFRVR